MYCQIRLTNTTSRCILIIREGNGEAAAIVRAKYWSQIQQPELRTQIDGFAQIDDDPGLETLISVALAVVWRSSREEGVV